VEHDVAGILQHRLAKRRAAQLKGRIEAAGQQNGNADPQAEAAQRSRKTAAPRAPRRRPLYPSHDAFSTIHATSSSKPMPTCRAISGTSEVGVIPGWVFTSSRKSR